MHTARNFCELAILHTNAHNKCTSVTETESQLHLHFDSDLSVKVHLFLQYRSCHKVDWWFIMVLSLSPFASNSLQFEGNLLWLQAIKSSFSAYSSSLTLFPLLQI